MKQHREKKSETLEVRLPHSKKEAFKAACEEEGITASHAVRAFIDAYLRRSRQMKAKRIAKDISMTLIRNPIKTTGGVAAAATAIIALFSFALPSVADTDVQPIAPPAPSYPIELGQQGLSANCQSTFNVSEEGFVETGIEVDCTHPGFVEVTRKAIRSLRFEPKIVDGEPVRMTGIVYPIEYRIEPGIEEISGPEAPN